MYVLPLVVDAESYPSSFDYVTPHLQEELQDPARQEGPLAVYAPPNRRVLALPSTCPGLTVGKRVQWPIRRVCLEVSWF